MFSSLLETDVMCISRDSPSTGFELCSWRRQGLRKGQVCIPVRGVGVRGWLHRKAGGKRDKCKLRNIPGSHYLASGMLATNNAGSIQRVWALDGGGGSSGGLAAKRLCVTAQLRGSAFDAFNIRTSELFFILRRKVRVSQPGQIAQGKFHFPFVGPLAFICWGCTCTFPLPHGGKEARWTQACAANLGHLSVGGLVRSRGTDQACREPEITSPQCPLPSPASRVGTGQGICQPWPVQPVWPPFQQEHPCFCVCWLRCVYLVKKGMKSMWVSQLSAPSITVVHDAICPGFKSRLCLYELFKPKQLISSFSGLVSSSVEWIWY